MLLCYLSRVSVILTCFGWRFSMTVSCKCFRRLYFFLFISCYRNFQKSTWNLCLFPQIAMNIFHDVVLQMVCNTYFLLVFYLKIDMSSFHCVIVHSVAMWVNWKYLLTFFASMLSFLMFEWQCHLAERGTDWIKQYGCIQCRTRNPQV